MLNLGHLGHAGHRSAVIAGIQGIIGISVLVYKHVQSYIVIRVNFMVIIEGQLGDSQSSQILRIWRHSWPITLEKRNTNIQRAFVHSYNLRNVPRSRIINSFTYREKSPIRFLPCTDNFFQILHILRVTKSPVQTPLVPLELLQARTTAAATHR